MSPPLVERGARVETAPAATEVAISQRLDFGTFNDPIPDSIITPPFVSIVEALVRQLYPGGSGGSNAPLPSRQSADIDNERGPTGQTRYNVAAHWPVPSTSRSIPPSQEFEENLSRKA
jgi:hypothetical protein